MLTILKFPKRMAGCTKHPRGPHPAGVFETPAVEFDLRIYLSQIAPQNWYIVQ